MSEGIRSYRRRRDSKLSRRQVDAAYQLYIERGLSLRELGRLTRRRFGFASPQSAAVSIHGAFLLEGYALRDRLAACRAASTVHGKARDPHHRRALRVTRGEIAARPTCAALKAQAPGRGRPCRARAQMASASRLPSGASVSSCGTPT